MDTTARFDLPLLAVAQAAKEMTVNEALTTLDAAVQPVVEGVATAPPASPVAGQGWLVEEGATGAFADRSGELAFWTAGGWRFVAPFEGMSAWRRDADVTVRRVSGAWQTGAAVSVPSGGSVIDVEARAAVESIVARMRAAGIISA